MDDLEIKTREQNTNNKRTEIELFDWFIDRIKKRVAFGWLSERSGVKTSCPRTFDVILQHDWPIEQCLLHITVFFGGKMKRLSFDLFIHWLIKQLTNTYQNHFSGSYENRSIYSWLCLFQYVSALAMRKAKPVILLLASVSVLLRASKVATVKSKSSFMGL